MAPGSLPAPLVVPLLPPTYPLITGLTRQGQFNISVYAHWLQIPTHHRAEHIDDKLGAFTQVKISRQTFCRGTI